MESALKQRLIGGAVLVALAVIFLPMLIKGPATESGAANVSLTMPDAPQDGMTTRTLPLGAPSAAGTNGAVGLQGEPDTLPTVDTRTATPGATTDAMLPAATAGGNYAVTFGAWATPADADRVIAALRSEQLIGYRESAVNRAGKPVQRVRIGPFATEADAEAARIRAGRVRSDLGAKVVVLDTGAVAMADPRTATAGTATPAVAIPVVTAASDPTPVRSTSTPAPLASAPPPKVSAMPAAKPPAPVVASSPPTPSDLTPSPPVTRPPPVLVTRPAAAGLGFAVQLGAFSQADEANKLRDKLRSAGFNAFVESVRSDKGMLNRVRVGPVPTRAEADALKSQVASRAGVSGDVRAHP